MSEDAHEASAWGPSLLLSEYRALLARADRAEAAEAVIEQVRELHRRHSGEAHQEGVPDHWCHVCLDAWPCATVRALPEVTP